MDFAVKYDPRSLSAEREAAIKVRDGFLYKLTDMHKRYHQPAYREDCKTEKYEPENHAFEWNSLVGAQVAFDNPRVMVGTGRPHTVGPVAKGIRHALNRWSEKTRLKEPAQRLWLDTAFAYGVLMVRQGNIPGYASGRDNPVPQWPVVERISPWQFFCDPLAQMFDRARYAGHDCAFDKDELIQVAQANPHLGWNAEVLEGITTTQEFDERDESIRGVMPDRQEIKITEMWVPGYDLPESPGPDEGYHGTIFTLVDGQTDGGMEDDWVRAPRPAYVSRWGPYVFAGIYYVPDMLYPLSPLMAVEGRVQELNSHATAMSEAMARYKKLVLIDSTRADLIQKINSPNSLVIPVQGLHRDDAVEFEIGGITEQHITTWNLLRERLTRASAISDAQRGNARDGTATANAIADEASSVRVGYIKSRFGEAIRQVFEMAADLMLKDDRVVFGLGDDAAKDLGMKEPYFFGGPVDIIDPMTGENLGPPSVDDLDISIEPYSMDQLGQGIVRQQMMESLQMLLAIAPQIPTMPYVKWKDVFNKIGDVNNDQDWSNMIDLDMAAAVGGLPGALPETPQSTMAGATPKGGRTAIDASAISGGRPVPAGGQQPAMAGQSGGQFATKGRVMAGA